VGEPRSPEAKAVALKAAAAAIQQLERNKKQATLSIMRPPNIDRGLKIEIAPMRDLIRQGVMDLQAATFQEKQQQQRGESLLHQKGPGYCDIPPQLGQSATTHHQLQQLEERKPLWQRRAGQSSCPLGTDPDKLYVYQVSVPTSSRTSADVTSTKGVKLLPTRLQTDSFDSTNQQPDAAVSSPAVQPLHTSQDGDGLIVDEEGNGAIGPSRGAGQEEQGRAVPEALRNSSQALQAQLLLYKRHLRQASSSMAGGGGSSSNCSSPLRQMQKSPRRQNADDAHLANEGCVSGMPSPAPSWEVLTAVEQQHEEWQQQQQGPSIAAVAGNTLHNPTFPGSLVGQVVTDGNRSSLNSRLQQADGEHQEAGVLACCATTGELCVSTVSSSSSIDDVRHRMSAAADSNKSLPQEGYHLQVRQHQQDIQEQLQQQRGQHPRCISTAAGHATPWRLTAELGGTRSSLDIAKGQDVCKGGMPGLFSRSAQHEVPRTMNKTSEAAASTDKSSREGHSPLTSSSGSRGCGKPTAGAGIHAKTWLSPKSSYLAAINKIPNQASSPQGTIHVE
jgi:hypothetical protein